jgi:hypothetical protein
MGDNAYLSIGSYADIPINTKNGLMSAAVTIHFPLTGGNPESGKFHVFLQCDRWRYSL